MDPLRLSVQVPSRSKKPRRGSAEFSIPEAIERADASLIKRPDGAGELVQRFVLPLDLCKTTNQLISLVGGSGRFKGRMSGSMKMSKHKDAVLRMMLLQFPIPRAASLHGRPLLHCVRFSSGEPDPEADGFKVPIDFLRMPKPAEWDPVKCKLTGSRKGLGFLTDDSRKHIRRVNSFAKASPGKGFGLLEIWTGETK